ncbi:hypothetical protein D8674_027059 [Pyrus ussuriensis x Pyrus communis]|uniref:Uncharacterized protein n=1 Tax=Pyrus ussuriensis x Pyrus communis TaxID=2448454 RepID=A0A5N5I8R3_9ROSA|nr:hypothetical protein D8674_027059 [Pyrus ussuriensis x Pyrus communis]
MALRANIGEAEEKGTKKQKNPDGREIKMMVQRETQNYSCFKPKVGSVFPAKRKSVKRMMFDRLVACFGSFLHSPPSSSSALASQAPKP